MHVVPSRETASTLQSCQRSWYATRALDPAANQARPRSRFKATPFSNAPSSCRTRQDPDFSRVTRVQSYQSWPQSTWPVAPRRAQAGCSSVGTVTGALALAGLDAAGALFWSGDALLGALAGDARGCEAFPGTALGGAGAGGAARSCCGGACVLAEPAGAGAALASTAKPSRAATGRSRATRTNASSVPSA